MISGSGKVARKFDKKCIEVYGELVSQSRIEQGFLLRCHRDIQELQWENAHQVCADG